MATFDDKSIFGKREEKEKTEPVVEDAEELEEEALEDSEEDDEEVVEEPMEDEEVDAKVIGEETVESELVRKQREKREKKEKKHADKEYRKLVKKHQKAMKKNPESIKRYDTDIENGLPDEIVEKRVLDNLVNVTKKGSSKSRKRIIISNIFTFFNILTLSIAIWLMTIQAWTDLVFLVIVTANICIGTYQELKAKKTIEDKILKELFGKIGAKVSVASPFLCDYGRNIFLGNNVSVNMNCTFVDCNKIIIGDNVLIASNVQLYTATHPVALANRYVQDSETGQLVRHTYALPIKIGNGCWLGGGVIVLPGVTIGHGSVIGAGSVVTKDIPENTLAVGNPCRVIRKINGEHT